MLEDRMIDSRIEELRRALDACPATPAGYREASQLRHMIQTLKEARA